MAKRVKCMDISTGGVHLECIRITDSGENNPFRVYMRKDYSHRVQIAKYGDFNSVICFIKQFFFEGMNKHTWEEVKAWAVRNGNI